MVCVSCQKVLAFDHTHNQWDRLLKKHVVITNNGTASWVRYTEFKKDQKALQNYLNKLSSVSLEEFSLWSKNKRLAFLINAYNAFTVELILTRYPDLESIRDTGSLFVSPWKKNFFTLLGQKRNLDDIEHNMIRKKGVYDDPRIHFAVNCASIGCPALRHEAFVYQRLDNQLEDSMTRFLSDTSRNRFNAKTKTLAVSKIFSWYEEDFIRTYKSLNAFFANYANLFAGSPEDLKIIKKMDAHITFLEYDWKLNDIKNMKRSNAS